MSSEPTTDLSNVLPEWLLEQRWYPGKGRPIDRLTDTGVVLAAGAPVLELHHVRVWYTDGDQAGYLVPVTIRHEPVEGLAGALIGKVAITDAAGNAESVWAYDALRDREQTASWLTLLAAGAEVGPILFRPEPGVEIPSGIPGDIVTTEQSNTSLVYGDEAILKVFRRLEPGINPDVEIHHALASTGNSHIAALLGSVEVRLAVESMDDGQDADLGAAQTATAAMVQRFLPGATDGWSLATTSVRDLYAEADLHAEEVGGDFASESHRLGVATASVHADLARVLPSHPAGPDWLTGLVEELHNRLDKATEMVPELEPHGENIRATYAALDQLAAPVILQRVHGDLHLGQVLRTVNGWAILDFEGEPARSIAVRRELDTPLRDVAGMLRSLDYAAQHLLVGEGTDPQLAYRATEWAARNRDAYCTGYAHAGGVDPAEFGVLLAALEADKAIYETVYEARNRPHWLSIPLHSFDRLVLKS